MTVATRGACGSDFADTARRVAGVDALRDFRYPLARKVIWEVTYCGEHIEVAHAPDADHQVNCACWPALWFSGYVCHRCSCFTCNAIKACRLVPLLKSMQHSFDL